MASCFGLGYSLGETIAEIERLRAENDDDEEISLTAILVIKFQHADMTL